jgi:hypothetical protein
MWRGQGSNLRRHSSADLQSAAINHSATPPYMTLLSKIEPEKSMEYNTLLGGFWGQKIDKKQGLMHPRTVSKKMIVHGLKRVF